jgi:hypothetical protein
MLTIKLFRCTRSFFQTNIGTDFLPLELSSLSLYVPMSPLTSRLYVGGQEVVQVERNMGIEEVLLSGSRMTRSQGRLFQKQQARVLYHISCLV